MRCTQTRTHKHAHTDTGRQDTGRPGYRQASRQADRQASRQADTTRAGINKQQEEGQRTNNKGRTRQTSNTEGEGGREVICHTSHRLETGLQRCPRHGSDEVLVFCLQHFVRCVHVHARAEQSRAEQSRAEQSRAEQSRTEQSRAEQSRAEQSRGRE